MQSRLKQPTTSLFWGRRRITTFFLVASLACHAGQAKASFLIPGTQRAAWVLAGSSHAIIRPVLLWDCLVAVPSGTSSDQRKRSERFRAPGVKHLTPTFKHQPAQLEPVLACLVAWLAVCLFADRRGEPIRQLQSTRHPLDANGGLGTSRTWVYRELSRFLPNLRRHRIHVVSPYPTSCARHPRPRFRKRNIYLLAHVTLGVISLPTARAEESPPNTRICCFATSQPLNCHMPPATLGYASFSKVPRTPGSDSPTRQVAVSSMCLRRGNRYGMCSIIQFAAQD